MGLAIPHTVGDMIRLQLCYRKNSVGVTGLNCRVALRDAITNKYLDFNDNAWKSSGWVQKYRTLTDYGNGIYHNLWDSDDSVFGRMFIMAEYECLTSGYEASDIDMLVFGVTEIVESGRWKIFNNQMVFYRKDGVTPLLTFDLFDIVGVPTMQDVTERVPVP